MTTDTVPKTSTAAGTGYTIGGMAKGAGMLAPGLATMLCVITTDADGRAAALDAALREATRTTFDRLDTDGCMSTNDTVLLLASGASGRCRTRPSSRPSSARSAPTCPASSSATPRARPRRSPSRWSARSEEDAVEVGRAVARSNLLKCAVYGEDPNWGRVLSAVGTTNAEFEPDQLEVAINGVWVCRDGGVGEDRSKVDLGPRDVTITIDLAAGPALRDVATTDLTVAYVHENTAYST